MSGVKYFMISLSVCPVQKSYIVVCDDYRVKMTSDMPGAN